MNNNQKKILEMLAENKISVAEAERLFSLTDSGQDSEVKSPRKNPKYLRVNIQPLAGSSQPGESERVNVRVPMSLLRAGMKLASIIPPSAYENVDSALKDKGIKFDLRDIKPENIEDLIEALGDMEVDIEDAKNRVKVYTE
jgi:hypothetical protein